MSQELQKVSLLPLIGRTAKFMDYYISDYMKEHGIDLSKEQFIVLKYLHLQDGRIQNDLAFITNRSKTALTRLIQTMEKKDLVYRVPSRKDLRSNHVYLTETGHEIWEKSHPYFQSIVAKLQEGLSQEELEVTQRSLEKIQENLKKKTILNNNEL